MKAAFLFALIALVAACGKDTKRVGRAPDAVLQPGPVAENACPLAFAEGATCGEVKWTIAPIGGKKSALSVRFWNKGKRDVIAAPAGTITAFLKMRCCGTVTAVPLIQNQAGEYVATAVKLSPEGEYDLFVQVVRDGKTEKQSVPVIVP